MSDNFIKIRIGSEFDGKGTGDAAKGFRELTGDTQKFVDTVKLGAGIDIGGRLVNGIAEITNGLKEAIQEGVRFNAEMETLRLTLAGMQKQFAGGSFDHGLQVSDALLSKMRTTANELGISFEAMTETYKTTAGAMFNSGITDLKQQLDLTVLLQRAMAGMGISGFQATRDTQDIFTGMADRTKAGRELGISDADIEKAKEQGNLYQFLNDKLSGFTEAGSAGTHTLTAEMNRLHNEVQQLEAEISKPIFDALKDGLGVLNQELAKPEEANALRTLGFEIGEIVGEGMKLIEWAVRWSDVLVPAAKAVGLLSIALAALQVGNIAVEIGMWTASLVTSKGTLDEETAALARNTIAQAANAAARGVRGASSIASTAGNTAANLEMGELAGRAAWLAQQRMLRAGGTTFAKYEANTIGGVVMGQAGSTAARLGTSAVGGAAGAGLTSLATGALAAVAAIAGLVVAATTLGVALWDLHAASADQKKTLQTGDLNTNKAVYDRLLEMAKIAMPGDREKIEHQVTTERTRIKGFEDRETDPKQKQSLHEDLLRLDNILNQFDVSSRQNKEDSDKEYRQDQADSAKREANAREIAKQEGDAMRVRMNEAAGEASIRAGLQSDNPTDKLAALQEKAQQARDHFRDQAYTTAKIDPQTASPGEMIEASKQSLEGSQKDAIGAAEELADTLREIDKLQQDLGKGTEEQMHKEAERFLQADQARKGMAEEKAILAATAAGEFDVTAAAARQKEIQDEINKLVKDHLSLSEATALATENAQLKAKAAQEAATRDLTDEHAIMVAKIAGQTSVVEKLERELAIRKEIEGLEKQNVSKGDATRLATQHADDAQGLKDRDRDRKLQEIQADDAAANAATRHNPAAARKAADSAADIKRTHQLQDQGYDDDTVKHTVADEATTRRRREGIIGGPTTRSDRDHLGDGLTPDDAWKKMFSQDTGPDSTLDPTGTNFAPGNRAEGLTSDSDWNSLFPRSAPIGPQVAEPSNRPAGGGGGGGHPAGGDDGSDMSGAADALNGAAGATQGAVTSIQTAATTISTAIPQIVQAIQDIQQQISDLADSMDDSNND